MRNYCFERTGSYVIEEEEPFDGPIDYCDFVDPDTTVKAEEFGNL